MIAELPQNLLEYRHLDRSARSHCQSLTGRTQGTLEVTATKCFDGELDWQRNLIDSPGHKAAVRKLNGVAHWSHLGTLKHA